MRKVSLAVAALTLILGPSLSRAADQPSAAQPSGMNAPSSPGSAAVVTPQAPPSGWTSLNGTVQAVDQGAKIVQIQDTTGALLQVPVDRQVSIQKDGKKVQLSQVQTGDSIILAKRNPTSQEQDKPKAY